VQGVCSDFPFACASRDSLNSTTTSLFEVLVTTGPAQPYMDQRAWMTFPNSSRSLLSKPQLFINPSPISCLSLDYLLCDSGGADTRISSKGTEGSGGQGEVGHRFF